MSTNDSEVEFPEGSATPATPGASVPRPAICRYPLCHRPTVPGTGTGRPPQYCEDPDHHAVSAWRERQRLKPLARDMGRGALAAAEQHSAAIARPVSHSHASLTTLADGLREQVQQLTSDLWVIVDDLRVIGDPDATAAELATLTEQSRREVADSVALAVRAEQGRAHAEQVAAEAGSAAREATRTAAQLTDDLAAARADLAAARADLEAATADVADVARQRDDALTQLAQERRVMEGRLADQRRSSTDQLAEILASAQHAQHLRSLPTSA